MNAAAEDPAGAIRIVRVIARLNIGGPAIQALTLTKRLEAHGYTTTLVRGREEPDEGNMDHLAAELGVTPVLVPWLRRNPGWHDLPALLSLALLIRRERPQIVHTHAAKGGTLGRLATLIAFPRKRTRPVLIHTYHGHSLRGYFTPRATAVYRAIEQLLGQVTDRLVAVSEEVRDELVSLRVAPAGKFTVVPLGFDLSPFTVNGTARQQMRDALRAELGIPPDARVVTLVARLVPIKRVDRFLRVALALRDLPDVRFLIVGDGELRDSLQTSPEAQSLTGRLVWAGFRRDMPSVYFASDVVVQTSDSEGTPVALIEAHAAGVPVVTTEVGGTASVVRHMCTGLVAPPRDLEALIREVRTLHEDPDLARNVAREGQRQSTLRYALARLASDVHHLYAEARGLG